VSVETDRLPGDQLRADQLSAANPLRRAAAEVAAAVTLLTRLRVGGAATDTPGSAAFPLVGALVGGLAAVPLLVAQVGAGTEPDPALGALAAVGALAVGALVSGFLHLDGLADTADALLAPDRGRAEEARRDPAIGPGGAVTLILVIGGEIAALVTLWDGAPGVAAAAFVVSAVVARTVPVIAVRTVASGSSRAIPGLGGWFASRVRGRDAAVAAAEAIAIVVIITAAVGWDLRIGAAAVAGGAVGVGTAAWLARARGRLDGDGLGATIELTALAVLVLAALLVTSGDPWRIP
jgi:adenosylcobinamide-GDP ribazoletransferase